MQHPDLPVIVIGAGPAGLAAAAQLRSREMSFLVLEAGPVAGSAVREWSHVRLFSPWSELIDSTAATLLESNGWTRPQGDQYPTGGAWVDDYLQPLADALGGSVRFGTRAVGVAKRGRDRLVDSGRDQESFTVHVETASGEQLISARAVIDASGTWGGPNPLGGDGLPAPGERAGADRITYRIPDLGDPATRARYAGRHVVVAGTGASAKGALIGLAKLVEEDRSTRISWLVRRASVGAAFEGSDDDELAERGALGKSAKQAVESGAVHTLNSFRTATVDRAADGTLTLTSVDGQVLEGVDEVIALTGFRPDLSMLSEIRLDLDPVLDAPRQLAPLIDPNVHSCGTVYPHGAKELAQPEAGFYLAGMKSYGRATSFLSLTGFEQTRSIVAELAGDHEASARVELTLPETGVCGGSGTFDDDAGGGGCCGSPAVPQLLALGTRPPR
ncbi:NAD(P)-binding domain-containing protein [Aeromicrobium sp. NPDC092404]|uniref:NAD(P)-binding domain-containing protein n=1 Tax=Aeromicrobium sp. NPDC092404 TaxID=3154976 RepID=UPI003418E2BF